MRELMKKYLSLKFPDAYMKKSKFGLVVYYGHGDTSHLRHVEVLTDMVNMFSCSKNEANDVLYDWIDGLKVFSPIPNSTNPDVLISDL